MARHRPNFERKEMDISKDCAIWKLCNKDRGPLGGVYYDAALQEEAAAAKAGA